MATLPKGKELPGCPCCADHDNALHGHDLNHDEADHDHDEDADDSDGSDSTFLE